MNLDQNQAPPRGRYELAFVKNGQQEILYFAQREGFFVVDTIKTSYVEFWGSGDNLPPPRIPSLRVMWNDIVAYHAIYEQTPERWNDWKLGETGLDTASGVTFRNYRLNFRYTPAQAWFIIENLDSTRSYEARFRGSGVRDSVMSIPRGISARVLHRISYPFFQENRFQVTQDVLNRNFFAEITLRQGLTRLDSAKWIQETNVTNNLRGSHVQYCRFRIPAQGLVQ
ncbi:MAG: hypothetical protein EAZ92_01550 [Candidatus Kapaibacterium sp.]|nr:MAG: hypothetical protein EAZ92_01550 [Candidatus Kapabacteria bacterium]